MPKPPDDDRLMSLVDRALAQPPEAREAWLQCACSGDNELFLQVREYVNWEERMRGFLLDPAPSLSPEQTFVPGQLLDERFRIVRELAHGGMGIVYEAFDQKLGRRIALKCALPGFGTRLTPEALLASEISHPNVCRTFEIHTASTPQGKVEFLTMEFVEGQTLTECLRNGPLGEQEARDIALGIARGLAEAHRCHVVHGDLKSNNVILESSAEGGLRPVITDFGLARGGRQARNISLPPDAPTGQSSAAGGTPAYMAPELWKGEKASLASDVYAFGVILYELAKRHRPYPAQAGSYWPAIRKLPPAHSKWDRIIERCLAPDPARRYPDAGEVAQALEPSRSWPWWLSAAAAVLLAAISGTVSYNRAIVPRDSVRLAVLPLEAAPAQSSQADDFSLLAAQELKRIKGGKRARLSVVPFPEVIHRNVKSPAQAERALGATHVLRGRFLAVDGETVLQIFLTETHSEADKVSQEFHYRPAEIRYGPRAIAGLVTAALRLPPLPPPSVNRQASVDYRDGTNYARRNSTLDRAIALLERAVTEDSDSPLTWAGLAEAQWQKYYVTKDVQWLERCSESLREAERRDPDVAPAHLVSARLKANESRYETAESEYLRAIELDPANGDPWRLLGQIYTREVGRVGEARAAFQRAVEVEPLSFKACQDLGAFYKFRGELKAAAGQLEHCVQLGRDEPDAHRILGLIDKDLGHFADAVRETRAALGLAETPDALVTAGVALMYESLDAEALPYLVRAVQISPGESLAWMDLGDAYRRTGSPLKARNAYRNALKSAERISDARDGAIGARIAYLCARLKQPSRAEAEITRAIQLSPDSNDIRESAVWTWEALGKREKSIDVLTDSSDQVLVEVLQWPDLADLHQDFRFKRLLASHRIESSGVRNGR